jgi:hypothetical protein
MIKNFASVNAGSSKVWLAALAATVALLGCGGGGGDGYVAAPGATTSVTPTILDSFGQIVAAGGGDGVGVGDSGADGTAGDGAAIVGGAVVLTDTNGKTVSGVTDVQGYYRVKVTGFAPPFVAKVTKADGKVYRSINVKTLKVNGFVTLNITGLTDKVASDVARAGGKSGSADLTPQIVAAYPDAINQSINGLRLALAPVISAGGIDVNGFDPLAVPFRPNHTGYDFVLDNTKVTIAADGSTQVTVAPTFGLSGNWQQTIVINGQTFAGGIVPGSSVPTANNLTQSAATQILAPTKFAAGGTTYTISASGNTTTITGPNTNFTVTINNYSFTNYMDCGACGINSSVSVTLDANFTAGGTLDGQSIPTLTTSYSAMLTWKRVN